MYFHRSVEHLWLQMLHCPLLSAAYPACLLVHNANIPVTNDNHLTPPDQSRAGGRPDGRSGVGARRSLTLLISGMFLVQPLLDLY